MHNDLLCSYQLTLLDAYRKMNTSQKEIVFVLDEEERLVGVLTDGDIRRLIAEGRDFSTSLSSLSYPSCKLLMEGEDMAKALEPLAKDGFKVGTGVVRILPVVNHESRVVDAVDLRETAFLPVASPDIGTKEFNYLVDAYLSGWISSSGQYIGQFEDTFSEYVGVEHGVACSNGTSALHLALLALGVGPGDEVIVPDLTFAATINAVFHAQATPIIVDVEPEGWTIDCDEIRRHASAKTKAVIAVHVYGQPCDMTALRGVCDDLGLALIEDCAEAHGAKFDGKMVGSFGDISCFSFFANKILTTGEGGMCLTASSELADTMRKLRDHGMSREKKYFHDTVGFNYRMTNLQAAIGCAQVSRIDEISDQRLALERAYREALEPLDLFEFQPDLERRTRTVWLVVALVKGDSPTRDAIISALRRSGIDCRNFFYPLSDMPVYAPYKTKSEVTQSLSERGLCFPTTTTLKPDYVERLRDALLEWQCNEATG